MVRVRPASRRAPYSSWKAREKELRGRYEWQWHGGGGHHHHQSGTLSISLQLSSQPALWATLPLYDRTSDCTARGSKEGGCTCVCVCVCEVGHISILHFVRSSREESDKRFFSVANDGPYMSAFEREMAEYKVGCPSPSMGGALFLCCIPLYNYYRLYCVLALTAAHVPPQEGQSQQECVLGRWHTSTFLPSVHNHDRPRCLLLSHCPAAAAAATAAATAAAATAAAPQESKRQWVGPAFKAYSGAASTALPLPKPAITGEGPYMPLAQYNFRPEGEPSKFMDKRRGWRHT